MMRFICNQSEMPAGKSNALDEESLEVLRIMTWLWDESFVPVDQQSHR